MCDLTRVRSSLSGCVGRVERQHFWGVDFLSNKLFITHPISCSFFFASSLAGSVTALGPEPPSFCFPRSDGGEGNKNSPTFVFSVLVKSAPLSSRKLPFAARLTPTHPVLGISKKLKCYPLEG